MTFVRGHTWTNRLTWLLPSSERWPHQTITVEISPEPFIVNVGYNVRLSFSLACAPSMLVREARELEGLLQPECLPG